MNQEPGMTQISIQQDDRLNLTASAFYQLGQYIYSLYTSNPGRRGYCYAELAVSFPSGGR